MTQFNEVDVLELTRELGREPNISTALHILQWELGDLAKAYTYSQWHPVLSLGYRGEAKKAIADMLFQLEVVAQLLGTTSTDLATWGIDTVKDRIKEKTAGTGRFKDYIGEEKTNGG